MSLLVNACKIRMFCNGSEIMNQHVTIAPVHAEMLLLQLVFVWTLYLCFNRNTCTHWTGWLGVTKNRQISYVLHLTFYTFFKHLTLYIYEYIRYLKTLSVSRLYSADDRMTNEYGKCGSTRSGWRNRSTRKQPAAMPPCPPQIPHNLTWDQTQADAVGSKRLTAELWNPPPYTLHSRPYHSYVMTLWRLNFVWKQA
jgi:hypothetical protein